MFSWIRSIGQRLIAWGERHTKTDVRYFAHGGFWLAFGQSASTLNSFVLGLAFANLLPKEGYGTYQYVLSVMGAAAAFTLPEMDTAIARSVARGHEADIEPARRAQQRWALIGTLICAIAAFLASLKGERTATMGLLLAGISLPLLNPYGLYEAFLQGRKKFQTLSWYTLLIQLTTGVAILITIFLSRHAAWVLAVYFFAWTTLRFFLYRKTFKNYPPNPSSDPDCIRFGKQLSLIKGLSQIAGNASQILLYHILGGAGLSIFFVAIAPIEQLRGWMNSVGGLIIPKTAALEWHIPSLTDLLKKTAPLFTILLLGALIYIPLAPWFYKILFSRYPESVSLSQVYMFSLIPTLANMIVVGILKAKGALRELHILNALDIGLIFTLSLPLTYFFHIFGLILAIMIIKGVELIWSSYAVFFILRKKERAT